MSAFHPKLTQRKSCPTAPAPCDISRESPDRSAAGVENRMGKSATTVNLCEDSQEKPMRNRDLGQVKIGCALLPETTLIR